MSEEKKEEKVVKYRRDNKPVEVKFTVLIYSDGRIECVDSVQGVLETGITASEESFSFIKPWFSLHQFIKSMALTSNQLLGVSLNSSMLENVRLQYLVKSCSMITLDKGLDSQGFEYITNFDEIVGENGLHEDVIRYIVRKMYDILGA